jgi:hypothetical protein
MNENDQFPPSNLPPESQPWGRKVVDEVYSLLNEATGTGESVQGLNRNTASSLETLAGQIRDLETQVQRVNDLYNALPIPAQQTATETNFGLSSSSWNTVATVTFTPPANGTLLISAIAQGQLVSASTSTNMEIEVRLAQDTSYSPVTPGLAASPDGVWQNNFLSQWAFTVTDVKPDRPVTVSIQIDPVTAASWGTGTGSYVVLVGRSTFIPG